MGIINKIKFATSTATKVGGKVRRLHSIDVARARSAIKYGSPNMKQGLRTANKGFGGTGVAIKKARYDGMVAKLWKDAFEGMMKGGLKGIEAILSSGPTVGPAGKKFGKRVISDRIPAAYHGPFTKKTGASKVMSQTRKNILIGAIAAGLGGAAGMSLPRKRSS